nr:hypothetical protein [Tanacetum cinerariifolium]
MLQEITKARVAAIRIRWWSDCLNGACTKSRKWILDHGNVTSILSSDTNLKERCSRGGTYWLKNSHIPKIEIEFESQTKYEVIIYRTASHRLGVVYNITKH